MANCPFCHSGVDEDLLVFGGTCPKCFGEIPGEEAPTDPGEQVRKKQEAADRRGLRMRRLVRAALVAMLLFSLSGLALVLALRPEPEMPVLDLDAAEFYTPDLDELVAWEEPEQEEQPKAVAKRTGRSGQAATSGPSALERLAAGEIPGGDEGIPDSLGGSEGSSGIAMKRAQGVGDEGIADLAPVAGPTAAKSGLAGLDGLGPSVERRQGKDVKLTDDAAIIAMVRRVMGAEMRKLKQCYQQRLKENESLAGRWELNFTVTSLGKTADVVAVPRDVPDAEFEACVGKMIEKWEFNPIKADLPVKKTVTFRPS